MLPSEHNSKAGQIKSLQARIEWYEFALMILVSLSTFVLIMAAGFTATLLVATYIHGYEYNVVFPMTINFVACTLLTLTVLVACQRTTFMAKLNRLQLLEDLKTQGT